MFGLVLVVACMNLTNLLLARGVSRGPEVALRLALGATRLQIVRRLLLDGIILSLAGGVVGLALAYWGTALVVSPSASVAVLVLRDPLILSRESIRRNRSVEQTSPAGWTLHNVARPG